MRGIALLAVLVGLALGGASGVSAGGEAYEVWVVDQSGAITVLGATGPGGTLYVYDGPALAGEAAAKAQPERIDLAGACGGGAVRPHMLMFSPTRSHAILAYVGSGHVQFIDSESRSEVGCIDVGLQAHAAFPAPNGEYVVVANQNGKQLHWIATDYDANEFTLTGTLDLAAFEGAGRPDNAPICPIVDSTSTLTFVTLRGGGLLVVDTSDAAMEVVGRYDNVTVHPNGCGGIEAAGKMYITSGGGIAANPVESDLYAFPLTGYSAANPENVPAPVHVFSRDGQGFVDTHGGTLTKHGRYLWLGDRADNSVTVVDTMTDAIVNEIELAGSESSDPAPDLLGISPSGNRVFMSLRGPRPLTGNAPAVNNAVGNTPGVGVVRVEEGGRGGTFQAIARISRVVDGVERADPHAVAVRSG
jgi:DNA-binding beta-propeller fold protein YncE